MPEREQRVRLTAAKPGAQSQREARFVRITEGGEYLPDDFGEIASGMGVAKEETRIFVNVWGARMAGDDVTEVCCEDRVLQVSAEHVPTRCTSRQNTHGHFLAL